MSNLNHFKNHQKSLISQISETSQKSTRHRRIGQEVEHKIAVESGVPPNAPISQRRRHKKRRHRKNRKKVVQGSGSNYSLSDRYSNKEVTFVKMPPNDDLFIEPAGDYDVVYGETNHT